MKCDGTGRGQGRGQGQGSTGHGRGQGLGKGDCKGEGLSKDQRSAGRGQGLSGRDRSQAAGRDQGPGNNFTPSSASGRGQGAHGGGHLAHSGGHGTHGGCGYGSSGGGGASSSLPSGIVPPRLRIVNNRGAFNVLYAVIKSTGGPGRGFSPSSASGSGQGVNGSSRDGSASGTVNSVAASPAAAASSAAPSSSSGAAPSSNVPDAARLAAAAAVEHARFDQLVRESVARQVQETQEEFMVQHQQMAFAAQSPGMPPQMLQPSAQPHGSYHPPGRGQGHAGSSVEGAAASVQSQGAAGVLTKPQGGGWSSWDQSPSPGHP